MVKLLKALSGDWKEEIVILRGYNARGFVGAWLVEVDWSLLF